jgi:uncharacterized membrane protein YbhN (UPF0104 family)
VARPLAGVLILGVLAYRLGAEPFVEGLRSTGTTALMAALAITAVTTWCCARRWSLLAGRLQVAVPVRTAYAACYRAQFVNATLPGGVVGDVHRAIRHGRDAGAMARGVRSVVWDRVTGQVTQIGLVVLAIPLLPGQVRSGVLWAVAAVAVVAAALHVGLPSRVLTALVGEVRTLIDAAGVWQRAVGLSAVAACGHLVVFVIAARSAGVAVPAHQLFALGLVVMLASAIPLNVAGWGPREGAAAWVFAAAGLGASTGVQVAVVYGVLSLVATLPGALALRSAPAPARQAELAGAGAAHG